MYIYIHAHIISEAYDALFFKSVFWISLVIASNGKPRILEQ